VRGLSGNWQSYRNQLFLDHDHRSAQFLPTVARSALNLPLTSESRALARKDLRAQRVTVIAHTGQSSQLVFDINNRNAQFFKQVR